MAPGWLHLRLFLGILELLGLHEVDLHGSRSRYAAYFRDAHPWVFRLRPVRSRNLCFLDDGLGI